MVFNRKIAKEKNKQLIGKKIDVFIEDYHPETDLLLQGRAWDMAPEVDPIVIN